MSTVVPQEELVSIEMSNIHHSNADCRDTEKHQQNAPSDDFGNVDREENYRRTNKNSERKIISSGCGMGSGVQGSSVRQSQELLTNEIQQEQPMNPISHEQLHILTELQQQQQKLLNETETSQTTLGSGVQGSSVGQSQELLTNEIQQEQPMNPILHEQLHILTELQQQQQKLLNETETSQTTLGSGVQGSSVGQSQELLTNEIQQAQPMDPILHEQLHILTEIKELLNEAETSQTTQVVQQSVLSGAARTRTRTENAELVTMNLDVRAEPGTFDGSECGKQFKTRLPFVEHSRIHPGEKSHKCEQCDRAYRQKSHLTVHQRTHSGETPFKCHICNYATAYSGHLSQHLLTHNDEKTYICDICKKAYRQSCNLATHRKTHAGVENSNKE